VQLVYVNFDEERRATHPRNLFVLGQHAKVSVVVEHLGLSQAVCFNNSVNEFVLADSAQADCTLILSEGPQGWHLANTCATLQAHAKLSVSTVTFSGLVNRHSIRPIIKGEGAHVSLNGLDVLDGKSEVYHHTVAEHWVPNGVSEQLYKAILDDDSKSEFNSLVFVAKDAVGTDSHQLNKALLLSKNAHMWTRPQLQINTDDVKCAHGAAVGQLDETQLFYLASRGLDRELAQSLLTYGFAEDIIQRIANPKIRQYLDGRVLNNLHRLDTGTGAALKQQLGA
jgi:Fe-S cluster assembly protein SufD